ncbi:MAG: hypothetical protein WC716_14155 [Chitinophagaceae bacterium]|jgi:hypothetical protein
MIKRLEPLADSPLFENLINQLPVQYHYLTIINKTDEKVVIVDRTFTSGVLQNDAVPRLGFMKPISKII